MWKAGEKSTMAAVTRENENEHNKGLFMDSIVKIRSNFTFYSFFDEQWVWKMLNEYMWKRMKNICYYNWVDPHMCGLESCSFQFTLISDRIHAWNKFHPNKHSANSRKFAIFLIFMWWLFLRHNCSATAVVISYMKSWNFSIRKNYIENRFLDFETVHGILRKRTQHKA